MAPVSCVRGRVGLWLGERGEWGARHLSGPIEPATLPECTLPRRGHTGEGHMPVDTRGRSVPWSAPDWMPSLLARGAGALAQVGQLVLGAAYTVYERRLFDEILQRPMPRHVGIILDGNRRHGRSRGLTDPLEVYMVGAQK